ncbi:MAG: hypothetical protein Q9181_004992 [Wetmoreana brouardii]
MDALDQLSEMMRREDENLKKLNQMAEILPNEPLEQRDAILANKVTEVKSYKKAVEHTEAALEKLKQENAAMVVEARQSTALLAADVQLDADLMRDDPVRVGNMLRDAIKARPYILAALDTSFAKELRELVTEKLANLDIRITDLFQDLQDLEPKILADFKDHYESGFRKELKDMDSAAEETQKSLLGEIRTLETARDEQDAVCRRLKDENEALAAALGELKIQVEAVPRFGAEITSLTADVEDRDAALKEKEHQIQHLEAAVMNQNVLKDRIEELERQEQAMKQKEAQLEQAYRAKTDAASGETLAVERAKLAIDRDRFEAGKEALLHQQNQLASKDAVAELGKQLKDESSARIASHNELTRIMTAGFGKLRAAVNASDQAAPPSST